MNMEMLDDKVTVITGGGSGMGAAMAKEFAKRGAKVAIFDLNEEKSLQIVEEITAIGGEACFFKTDVTQKNQVDENTLKAAEKYGRINSWINSAGFSKMAPFLESSEELWDVTMNVNLKGTFLCCQAAVRQMLDGGGTIVNMSSLSGKKPSSWQTIYCASKFGVQGLSQSIAKEFADKGIRVNTICP